MMRRTGVWFTLAAALLIAQPAQATTILFDDFNDEALGLNTALDVWTISDGTVDVIGPGLFDVCTPAGSASRCVDLDGSSGNAGTIEHAFALAPGDYSLTYLLAGSQRGDTNTVNVSLGGLYSDVHVLASSAVFDQFGGFFTVLSPTNASLIFSHEGGDNLGLLLDDVRLELRDGNSVPEPTTLFLFGAGAAGFLANRQRKASRR